MSLPAHFTMESTNVMNAISNSQPTLNAINQQAVASLGTNRVKPPHSPMAVTSPHNTDVCLYIISIIILLMFWKKYCVHMENMRFEVPVE